MLPEGFKISNINEYICTLKSNKINLKLLLEIKMRIIYLRHKTYRIKLLRTNYLIIYLEF